MHGTGLGIDVQVVRRPQVKGFQPPPQRWVIARTFGRPMQHRRLARDYEALPQRSRTVIHWAMARTGMNIDQMPPEGSTSAAPRRSGGPSRSQISLDHSCHSVTARRRKIFSRV